MSLLKQDCFYGRDWQLDGGALLMNSPTKDIRKPMYILVSHSLWVDTKIEVSVYESRSWDSRDSKLTIITLPFLDQMFDQASFLNHLCNCYCFGNINTFHNKILFTGWVSFSLEEEILNAVLKTLKNVFWNEVKNGQRVHMIALLNDSNLCFPCCEHEATIRVVKWSIGCPRGRGGPGRPSTGTGPHCSASPAHKWPLFLCFF